MTTSMNRRNEDSSQNGGAGLTILFALVCAAVAFGLLFFEVDNTVRAILIPGLFVLFAALVYLNPFDSGRRREPQHGEALTDEIFDEETEDVLLMLEDAGSFLGSSVSPEDMFRLVTERIQKILPISGASLFVVSGDGGFEKELRSSGQGVTPGANELATKALNEKRATATSLRTPEPVQCLAIPLQKAETVFAVCVFILRPDSEADPRFSVISDAVAERLAPVLAASLAVERSTTGAMTDALTGLPNERAFRLILENRVAEARRFRNQLSLSLIALDIEKFAEINSSYGHSSGDKVLVIVGETIKGELRSMDLVARTSADEYLVILPQTASDKVQAAVTRLRKALSAISFEAEIAEGLSVSFSFGSSTFGESAESASELIEAARAARDASKTRRSNQVLRFPTKYNN